MTGRELIVYILEHNLEDVEMFEDGTVMTIEEKAAGLATGIESVKTMYKLGMVPGLKIGDSIFFLRGM